MHIPNITVQSMLIGATMLIASGQAASLTICAVPCGTTIETRSYQYEGYLTDLTLASTQTLPFELNDFYTEVGITGGAAVPVSIGLTVNRSQEFLGDSIRSTGHDYWYNMQFGNFSLSGSVVGNHRYGVSSFAVSPFRNDRTDSTGTVDALDIFDTDFHASTGSTAITLASREEANTPGSLAFYQDYLDLELLNSDIFALDSVFPADESILNDLFTDGSFRLRSDIQVRDAAGNVTTPFNNTEAFQLSGTFTSMDALFQPSTTEIASVCAVLSGCLSIIQPPTTGTGTIIPVNPIITPPNLVLTPVPLPGAIWLLASGMLLLFGFRRKVD